MAYCMSFSISPPKKSSSSDEEGVPILFLREFELPPTVSFGKVQIGSSKESVLIIHNPNKVNMEVSLTKLPDGFTTAKHLTVGPLQQVELTIKWNPTVLGASRKSIAVETTYGQLFKFFVLGECVQPSSRPMSKKGHLSKKAFLNSTRKNVANNENQFHPNWASVEANSDYKDNVFKGIEDLPLTPIRRETYMVVDESARSRALLDIPPENRDLNIQDEIFCSSKSKRESTHERKNWSPVNPVKTDNLLGLPHAIMESLSSNETLSSLFGTQSAIVPLQPTHIQNLNESLLLDDSLNEPNGTTEFGRGIEDSLPIDENVSMIVANEKRKLRRSYSDSQVRSFHAVAAESLPYEVEPSPDILRVNRRVSTAKKQMNPRNLCSISKVSFNLPDYSVSVIENKSSSGGETTNSDAAHSITSHSLIEHRDKFRKPHGLSKPIPSASKTSTLKKNKTFVSPKKSKGRVERSKSFSHVMKPVAQAKLSLFASSSKMSIPQHPNMFASKSMFYDERWQQKEETAFTRWINYLFTPPDEFIYQEDKIDVKVSNLWTESLKAADKSAVILPAPDKESLSLKLYTRVQNKNKLRQSACSLFQSGEITVVLRKIEEQISFKRIAIRDDRKLHADFGLKQIFLDLLLCYSPLWLHLGLETVFGELIHLPKSHEVITLSRFVVNRLLFCREIAMEFEHKVVPNSYREGYDVEISKFILRKFLFLIFFLDKAKHHHLIGHDPCLFNKTAKYKTNKEILICFSREFLKGEGDITRHLSQYGYVVSWQQKPLEEFKFAVTNLSQDLRCGTRLGRICELLFHSWVISDNLRVPAPSRTLKMRNVDHVLNVLKNCSVKLPPNLKSTDIVDGNREQTLALLWAIIFKTQVEPLISGDSLRKEILYLIKSCRLKKKEHSLKLRIMDPVKGSVAEASELYKSELSLRCLLRWCQVIGECYGIEVNNFTVSFSDGRALCYIIHHYHPNVLPKVLINDETLSSFRNSQDSVTVMTVEQSKMLLKNEKQNLLMAFEKMRELGCIPIVADVDDICNTIPDEKVVITLLTYLNARLSNLGVEIRAARIVQLAWKSYRLKKRIKIMQEEIEHAVCKIQKRWKATLLMRQERKRFIQLQKGVVKLQATFRMYFIRKNFLEKRSAAILIQRRFRASCDERNAKERLQAVIVIQRYWRSNRLTKKMCVKFHEISKKIIKVQSLVRMISARKKFLQSVAAVVKIQSFFKMVMVQQRLRKLKNAVQLVENKRNLQLLGRAERKTFLLTRNSAIKIQAWIRGTKERRVLNKQRKSAVVIQKQYRMFKARRNLKKQLEAVVTLQRFWRNYQRVKTAQAEYFRIKNQIIKCQSSVRMFLCRRQYKKIVYAVITIQSKVRMFLASKKFKKMKKCANFISTSRKAKILGRNKRADFLKMKCSAIKIQACFRGWKVRKAHLLKVSAAIKIQKQFRMFKLKVQFRKAIQATMIIQRFWRRCYYKKVAQLEINHIKNQVIKCQSTVRRYLAHRRYKKLINAVIKIQSCFKMLLAKIKYQRLKKSVNVIENARKAQILCRNQRVDFLMMKYSAVKIQAFFRGWKDRKDYLLKVSAAISIQKQFRMLKARSEYQKTLQATKVIQRFWKRYHFRKVAQAEWNCIKCQIIKSQSIVRMYLALRQYKKVLNATVKIQSNVKMVLTRNKFRRMKKFVKLVESKREAQIIGRSERAKLLVMKDSAVKIQSQFRCWRERKFFQQKVFSALIIQKQYRMYKARTTFLKTVQSAVLIQTFWRKHYLRKQAQDEFKHIKSQVIKVQAYCRMFLSRKHFKKVVCSVIKIQSYFRMILSFNKFQRLKKCVNFIETKREAQILGRRQKVEYLKMKNSATKIQACFRGWRDRKTYLLKVSAAIKIQKQIRMHNARVQFVNTVQAIITIQRFWRRAYYRKMAQAELNSIKNQIIKSQSIVRMFIARRQYKKQVHAAIKIQSHVKMILIRNRFQNLKKFVKLIEVKRKAQLLGRTERAKLQVMKESAVKIQSHFKSWIQRKLFKEKVCSAVIIQSHFRTYQARSKFLKTVASATLIQRFWRKHYLRKKAQDNFNYTKCQIVKVQAYFRRFLAQRRYKQALESLQIEAIEKKRTSAAITIQKHWRGYSQRKAEKNETYSNIRSSIKEACQKATAEKRYSYLTHDAVRVILTGRLNNLIQYLIHLEKASRLSEQCRKSMIEEGLVPALISLMRSCNRSLPHVEILTWCCNILLNFSVYDYGSTVIWSCDKFLEFFIDMLKRFQERDVKILLKMVSLVIVLCQDSPGRLNELKSDEIAVKAITHLFNVSKRRFEIRQNIEKFKQSTECYTKREKEKRRTTLIKYHNVNFQNPKDALTALMKLIN